MNPSAYHWTSRRVRVWACEIGYEGTSDLFHSHGIDGRDLFMLSDSDMKQELKLEALHDRKALRRAIQSLKEDTQVLIQVSYEGEMVDVLVSNPWAYTFDHLRHDLADIVHLSTREIVLQDRSGLVWGTGGILLVLDQDLNQAQSIFAVRVDSENKGKAVEVAEEDFDEERNGAVTMDSMDEDQDS